MSQKTRIPLVCLRVVYLFKGLPGSSQALRPVVESAARGKLYRYLAFIAYDNRDFSQAAAHLKRSVHAAPGRVLADRGTWFLILGLLMTERRHHGLDIFGRSVRRIFAVRRRRMITKGKVA